MPMYVCIGLKLIVFVCPVSVLQGLFFSWWALSVTVLGTEISRIACPAPWRKNHTLPHSHSVLYCCTVSPSVVSFIFLSHTHTPTHTHRMLNVDLVLIRVRELWFVISLHMKTFIRGQILWLIDLSWVIMTMGPRSVYRCMCVFGVCLYDMGLKQVKLCHKFARKSFNLCWEIIIHLSHHFIKSYISAYTIC